MPYCRHCAAGRCRSGAWRQHSERRALQSGRLHRGHRIGNREAEPHRHPESDRVLLHQVQHHIAGTVRDHALVEDLERDVLADPDDGLLPVTGDEARTSRVPRAVGDLVQREAEQPATLTALQIGLVDRDAIRGPQTSELP